MSRTAKSFIAPAVLAGILAACSAQTPPAQNATPPTAADQLGGYIGRKASDDVIAAITASRGDKPVRVLQPDSMVTMDYRPDRLNIDVDAKGIITGLRCT